MLITPNAASIVPVLVFIDESGDAGRAVGQGSSPLLVLAVVTFEDRNEAAECDRAIDDLAQDLGRGSQEFRFSKDSHQTRRRFLDAVSPFRFTFHAFVFDKRGHWPRDEDVGRSLYVWACGTALKNASAAWSDAVVVLDSMGDRRFQRELRRRLEREVKALRGPGAIRRVTSRRSHSERLLQLADYVAGIVSRQRLQRKWGNQYFATIRRRGTLILWR
ncbi:MAG: DUF3800 domain-containing protein [Chloroflexi bacterium]|nr:DUF3800 domain-containing protein [Chloroflexota bacterium]